MRQYGSHLDRRAGTEAAKLTRPTAGIAHHCLQGARHVVAWGSTTIPAPVFSSRSRTQFYCKSAPGTTTAPSGVPEACPALRDDAAFQATSADDLALARHGRSNVARNSEARAAPKAPSLALRSRWHRRRHRYRDCRSRGPVPLGLVPAAGRALGVVHVRETDHRTAHAHPARPHHTHHLRRRACSQSRRLARRWRLRNGAAP